MLLPKKSDSNAYAHAPIVFLFYFDWSHKNDLSYLSVRFKALIEYIIKEKANKRANKHVCSHVYQTQHNVISHHEVIRQQMLVFNAHFWIEPFVRFHHDFCREY